MAKDTERNVISGTTPIGIAVYPKLTEPDYKWKQEGEYGLKIRLSEEDALPLIATMEKLVDEVYTKAEAACKNKLEKSKLKRVEDVPCKEELDDDANPTGYYLLNAKMKASGVSKKTGKTWKRTPALFDSVGRPITDTGTLQIWSGSEVRVAYTLEAFSTALGIGCSCRLEAVQIIKLVSGGQKDAKGYGFDAEDSGFVNNATADTDNEKEDFADLQPQETDTDGDY